eukprot:CCRYP_012764-RA/>CCRYP_012764-RA protein AED:0.37 eAED:0.03 QI:0/0/0/0.5/1/1/4/0/472
MELHGSKRTPHFNEFDPSRSVSLSIFLKLFPWRWLRIIVLTQTNKNLDQELRWGELLRYLGLWFLMASVGGGYKKTDFWSTLPFNERTNSCPYNFRKYMSLKRFDAITAALSFTDASKPTYRDKFWEVRQLIVEWNKNMAEAFSPGWILCLDESMSIWHSRWTCPGWVFCPRKPHPFGNEYHSACCAGIGKTGGLLLRMLKSCFHSGRYVVLDSGFCVLKALVALHEKGIYAGALIKKRRYWPALVPGEAMDERFAGKSPGECEAITGTLNASPYFIWGMKEPDYAMRIMATGGVLAEDDSCRVTYRGSGEDRTTFRYKKPFDWHFRELERGETHDDLWDAGQLQLVREGGLHGFMRMYWAKKILEWTISPSYALATAQYFNDRYAYDGNDPNGFVGVGWSIMGIHDMGWKERPIFGKIRYMNYVGCKRKFKIDSFVARYKGAKENAIKAERAATVERKSESDSLSGKKRKA